MNILPIGNSQSNASINFKKMPSVKELPVYKSAVSDGLKVLNKELGIIIHNSSVPSRTAQNTGIGSLLSKTSEIFFTPFLKTHGFSTIQQEPTYIRRLSDPSPYDPISTSKNIYMIPIERLASEEYDFLLTEKEILRAAYKENQSKDSTKVKYDKVSDSYNEILEHAFARFTLRKELNMWRTILPNQQQIEHFQGLINEYNEFDENKREYLEPNAIYEILSKKYNNEDWHTWEEKDKNLYDSDKYIENLKEIKETYKDEINFHIFKQWLVEREISKTNARNEKLGIKIVADTPIAFTPAEEWFNKDLFIKDLSMGCPPDYYSSDGQRWGFAVFNHKKLFNPDGSLAKGGLFLQKRYEDIFALSPGGVRIDHLIGLIDPFVYKKSDPKMNETNSGRLYSSPEKDIFKEYTKKSEEEYLAIFTKIIFPTAEKFGITKDKIICEDLGHLTDPVKNAINKLNLTGIAITQYGYSGVDTPEKNVIMLGCHDNKSYIEYTDELFKNKSDAFMHRTHILGSDTVLPDQDVNQYREDLRNDKNKFMTASFTELFTSPAKKVQIFFTDFFGIGKTYNVPGAKKDCWTLRLNNNFEELYYDNLSTGNGINLPEVIANAIRKKGKDFSSQYSKLLTKLDYFAKVLKE